MKKMLQNFGSILSILFVIWQDFVIVWQNTPCTVCQPAIACLPHCCCWIVLPDVAIQHIILQKWCNFTCLCAWASERFFPGGDFPRAACGFSKSFSRGPKVVKFDFYRLKLRKQHFCWNVQIPAPLPTRPVTSLEHQGRRRVFWEGSKFFKLCPTLFSKGEEKFFRWVSPP